MQNITIRNATLADAPRILEIYAYYVEHTVISFEYDVPSLAEFEGRMRDIMKNTPTSSSSGMAASRATPMPTLLWDVPPTTGPQS